MIKEDLAKLIELRNELMGIIIRENQRSEEDDTFLEANAFLNLVHGPH
jgi:hypothetical protein